MMARRTAGRLGDGGGPGTWLRVFPRPRRATPGAAEVLQVSEGDAGHQRVPVQPRPGPPLEVPQSQLLLELLVRLLARPARLRSEEHTSELQSRQYLHSFPTRRSSDLAAVPEPGSAFFPGPVERRPARRRCCR